MIDTAAAPPREVTAARPGRLALVVGVGVLIWALPAGANTDAPKAAEPAPKARFQPLDVFQLEYASDPQISPDGKRIVYERSFMDIMTDRRRSNLWLVNTDGTDHRPLTTGNGNDGSARWSPDGRRLAYVSASDGTSQIWVRWMDTGQAAKLTNLLKPPRGLSWSPEREVEDSHSRSPSSR